MNANQKKSSQRETNSLRGYVVAQRAVMNRGVAWVHDVEFSTMLSALLDNSDQSLLASLA